MRTFIGTLIGLLFLGLLGPPKVEAVNILVREVRRERQPEGLSVVYELRNASVDRWDLRRVEVHVFDHTGRRMTLLRPVTTLARLEREDVEFIRARIPSTVLPEAHRLEVRIFVQEVLRFPVADPIPKRLVYAFPLRSETIRRLLRVSAGTLRVESAGMVQRSGGSRAILLRLINQGRETLSEIVLFGEISGVNGSLQRLRLPVRPKVVLPGAETYVSVAVPPPILNKAKGISLQALYRKAAGGEAVRYVEDLQIRVRRNHPEAGRDLEGAGWKSL